MSYYDSNAHSNYRSPLQQFFIYLCYFILAFIFILIILTVFNMDLFMSYFGRIGLSNSFGAFLSTFIQYVIAVFQHTFGLR